jgi:hypothetical protein
LIYIIDPNGEIQQVKAETLFPKIKNWIRYEIFLGAPLNAPKTKTQSTADGSVMDCSAAQCRAMF